MNVASVKPGLVYRDRLAVWADKYLFLLLFIAGTAGIITMKWRGFPQLIVTAVPVVAMFLYGAYVLFTPRYRIRSDRAGDSLYYLGFLYTMVSLAFSLYEFRRDETRTQDVVTNFGIALATTITGLMLRVVYHQLREDPFDVEQEARLQLSEAAALLHGVLLKAATDFDNLRLVVSQVLSEATEDAKRRITLVADEVATSTHSHGEFLTKFSEQAAEELRLHHTEMLAVSRNMGAAVKRAVDRLDKIDIPSTLISDRLDAVAIPADVIRTRLEKVDIPFDLLSNRLNRVEIPSDIFTTRFDSLISQLQTIIIGFADRAGHEAKTIQVVEELVRSSADAAQNLKLAIRSAHLDDEERRKQLNISLQIVANAVASLKSTTEALVQLSSGNVKENIKLLDGLSSSAALTLKTVQDHSRQLESDLRASGTAVQQVHGSLVDLTRTVVERLNERA